MRYTTTQKISFIFVLVSSIILMIYKFVNKNDNMERFYNETNMPKYYLLKYAKYVLYMAIFINIRYLIITIS